MLLLIAGAGVSGIIYLALTDTIGEFVSAGTFVSYMGAILLLMSPIKRLARINEYIQAGLAALEVPTILYAEESMINPVMTSKVEEAKAEAARARRREKAREAKAKKAVRRLQHLRLLLLPDHARRLRDRDQLSTENDPSLKNQVAVARGRATGARPAPNVRGVGAGRAM